MKPDSDPSEEERHWIRQILSGERGRYALFVERYKTPLARYVKKRAPAGGDWEGICQEAFLATYRRLDRLLETGEFPALLFGIARNLCHSAWRRHYVRERSEPPSPTPPANPADIVAQNDKASRVRQAVERLPAEQRDVVWARLWGGLTFPQIARSFDIPEGTAKSRMRLALAQLTRSLERMRSHGETL